MGTRAPQLVAHVRDLWTVSQLNGGRLQRPSADESRAPGLLPFPQGKHGGSSVHFFAGELLLADEIAGLANGFPATCDWHGLPRAPWGKHSEVTFGRGEKSCNQLVMSDVGL